MHAGSGLVSFVVEKRFLCFTEWCSYLKSRCKRHLLRNSEGTWWGHIPGVTGICVIWSYLESYQKQSIRE